MVPLRLMCVCLWFLLIALPVLTGQIESGPWSGAITPESGVVKAKIAEGIESVELVLSAVGQAESRFAAASTGGVSRVHSIELNDLQPDTAYRYTFEMDGHPGNELDGQFRTFPREGHAASFQFVFASCAGTGAEHAVFETIREHEPLFFLHTGDLHYQDIGKNEPELFRAAFDRVLASQTQARLYRHVPIAYIWDDHDYGPNDSDRTAPGREAARSVYREYVPHYSLAAGTGDQPIQQAFSVGRVRIILTDLRSERDPGRTPDGPEKTMMGLDQKKWFKQQLLEARDQYPLIFWVSTVPWIAKATPTGDHWGAFATERQEIANFIAENHIRGVAILAGDAHMLAADDGTNSDYSASGRAALPVMHASPLARNGSMKGGPYSEGTHSPERTGEGCFGLVTVQDAGDEIRVVFSGRNQDNVEKISLEFAVPAKVSH